MPMKSYISDAFSNFENSHKILFVLCNDKVHFLIQECMTIEE